MESLVEMSQNFETSKCSSKMAAMIRTQGPKAIARMEENIMQSFWTGTIAAIIIAVVAGMALESTSMSSSDKYSTSNVRLN